MKPKKFIIICCIIFMVLMVFFKILFNMGIDFSKFDRYIWSKYPNKRHEMIVSFEEKYSIEDLNKDKVIFLLGEINVSKTDNMYSYYIGGDFFTIQYYALLFDDDGQCVSRYIYND